MSERSRQRLRTSMIILATALVVAPAAALADHGFSDVDDGDFFHDAVDWMKDNGVTVGCNPPANTQYCPDDPVTRGEMAVFLERLDRKNVFLRPGEGSGGDGGDADTVDGKHASDFLGAGDIVLSSQRNWWVQNGDAATVGQFYNIPLLSSASATDLFHTELVTPAVIGGTSFGLKSVEVCYNAVDSSSKIDTTTVGRSTTANTGSTVANDFTNRTSVFPADECYTVPVNDTPPSTATYRLTLQVDGSVRLIRVSATFTPV